MPPCVSLQTVRGDKIKVHGKANITLRKTPTRIITKNECIIPGLVAENRKFRFGLIDDPDPDNSKGGVLVASSVVDLSNPDHSSDDLVKNLPQNIDLDEKQRCSTGELIAEFQRLFSRTSEDLGRTRLTQHQIDTGELPAIKQHPRRLPFAKQEEVQKFFKNMKDNDVIVPSSSPCTSPIVLVKKKNGSTRFYVDYHRLNDVAKKDS
ncbi:retrovirus-related Pol polyprotein from transposon 412 [Trichonephila clavipes]|nr:retrovirus-related Pol polyprotein from transposon 412 [Trichonephila clavipes]